MNRHAINKTAAHPAAGLVSERRAFTALVNRAKAKDALISYEIIKTPKKATQNA